MATRPVSETASDSTGDTKPPAPSFKYILFEINEFIARLTLNHAPHNVLTVPMMKEMAESIESLNGRADVKAILLQSSQQALSAGISLEKALGAFTKMYGKDAGLPLRAMGFFKDGDLPSLPQGDQDVLRKARDRVSEIPDVVITRGSLAMTAAASHQKRSQ